MNADHAEFLKALESRSYEKLFIRRIGSSCWLIIRLRGEDHVYVNRYGKSPGYRHAWQIRNWLRESYAIDPESVPVVI